MTKSTPHISPLRRAINETLAKLAPGTIQKYPKAELRGLTIIEAESIEEQLQAAQRKVEAYDRARARVKIEGATRAEYVLLAESALEQLETARTLIRNRCFMCAEGIPRRECEPFDMHNYTVSGLHSWRGNDSMFCGISTEEARVALDSYPALRQGDA